MSEEAFKDLYFQDQLFQADPENFFTSSKLTTTSNISSVSTATGSFNNNNYHNLLQLGFHRDGVINPNNSNNNNSFMSFTDCLQGPMDYSSLSTNAFGLSPSSSEVFSSIEGSQMKPLDHHRHSVGDLGGQNKTKGDSDHGGDRNPVTHSHSISSSSTEAGAEEDSKKDGKSKGSPLADDEEDHDDSKRAKGNKKKGDKKQKEPRFAFMTKSEVDHLEDGYRWRKYGQKAVKNSPYPRSYYRCTTQKCGVKKRVERSFTEPTTVITTYEGQHNHPLPSSLRGNAAAAAAVMFPPSAATAGLFPQGFMFHNLSHNAHNGFQFSDSTVVNTVGAANNSNNYGILSNNANLARGEINNTNINNNIFASNINNSNGNNSYVFQDDEFGLLQDIVPSVFLKHGQ